RFSKRTDVSDPAPAFSSGLRNEKHCAKSSVDFADLHVGVNGQVGIANRGAGGRRRVARGGGNPAARAFDGVEIAVASGARRRKRIGRDEFVERSAIAV